MIFILQFQRTALSFALVNKNKEIVKILLNHPKVDPNIKYIYKY